MSFKTERLQFTNSEGHTLDARLELPEGEILFHAIFVHCFTCSKDVHAATRVSRGLTQKGIAVLRFDFTGLGNSDGDFSNTNFSTNVTDIVSAYEFMIEKNMNPRLLIGHSLGGAAVLASADRMPMIKGVVTINAPSDIQHVEELFHGKIPEIEDKGEATVNLAGRSFLIKKQFLEDVRKTTLTEKISKLKIPLLIFHSPADEIVSSEHAKTIYENAPEPKSIMAMQGASHLLNDREDSDYVSQIVAAWCSRYLSA